MTARLGADVLAVQEVRSYPVLRALAAALPYQGPGPDGTAVITAGLAFGDLETFPGGERAPLRPAHLSDHLGLLYTNGGHP
jgi:hypothetical protein